MVPVASMRWVVVAHVIAFSSGRVMIRSMLLAGDGMSPRRHREMIFWRRSVLVVLSLMPRVWQKRSDVRKAMRPTAPRKRGPMPPKYPIDGIPKILLCRTAKRRGAKF